MEYTITSNANFILGLSKLSSISRISLNPPVRPMSPLCLFNKLIASSTLIPFTSIISFTTDGSRSPERVPITTPASGVYPIEVSIHFPSLIAQILLPLPKWHEIIFLPLRSPNNSAHFLAIYLWLVP